MTVDAPPAPDPWRRIALEPPRAWGETPVSGALRVELADFHVEERLGFAPDGGEAHRLLLVEKIGANTLFVVRSLAVRAGKPAADIGFAGQKDRRAVARQWFSVPASRDTASFLGYSGDGFRVLAEHPHSRKLRRGALAGNRFHIRVRGLQGDAHAIDARVAHVVSAGVPNYYGLQRFGRDGANLGRVRQWLESGRLPRSREPRAFLLSSARSLRVQCRARGTRCRQQLEPPAAGRGREPGRQPVDLHGGKPRRRAAPAAHRGRRRADRAAVRRGWRAARRRGRARRGSGACRRRADPGTSRRGRHARREARAGAAAGQFPAPARRRRAGTRVRAPARRVRDERGARTPRRARAGARRRRGLRAKEARRARRSRRPRGARSRTR